MPVALVIEDEPELAAFAVAVFHRYGVDAIVAESLAEALDLLERSEPVAAALVNITGETDELTVVRTIAERAPGTQIILLSGRISNLRDLPPSIFLAKPTTASTIAAIIRRVAWTAGEDPERGPCN